MQREISSRSPLLVIGMHRSGTRLVADIVSSLGVFMGADRQGDSESIAFIGINEAIFHRCGTFWSDPLPVHVALTDPEEAERIASSVRAALDARLAGYLGGHLLGDLPHFGWKDPRSTFTLPVWKRIFPGLKVIHVLRHGVDAASSLALRQRQMCTTATGSAVPSSLAVFREHSLGVLSSRRGWTLHEAFGLWEQYVEKARLEADELGDRALEVRFEDLVERPEETVRSLARFCGAERDVPRELLERVTPARAYAFRRDPRLVAFAEDAADILAIYGYSP